MSTKLDSEKIFEEYLKAYESANGKPAEFTVEYDRGWVRMRTMSGRVFGSPHRLKEIVWMTETLMARVRGDREK